MYIVCVSVFCIILPAFVIIGSHVGIFIEIRRSGSTMINRENGQQSIKAEHQFVLVSQLKLVLIDLAEDTNYGTIIYIIPSQVSFSVCSGFLIAWSPYAAVSLWSAFIGGPHSIPIWITS